MPTFELNSASTQCLCFHGKSCGKIFQNLESSQLGERLQPISVVEKLPPDSRGQTEGSRVLSIGWPIRGLACSAKAGIHCEKYPASSPNSLSGFVVVVVVVVVAVVAGYFICKIGQLLHSNTLWPSTTNALNI